MKRDQPLLNINLGVRKMKDKDIEISKKLQEYENKKESEKKDAELHRL